MLLEMIAFSATAPGAAGAAAAAVSGDSLTARRTGDGKPAMLVAAWGNNQTAGFHQLAWPSGHDVTRGFRYPMPAGIAASVVTRGTSMPVQAQELITATIAGSAAVGDIENGTLALWYESVPGLDARLIDVTTVLARTVRQTTVFATIATGTAGGWSGSEALNAESDLLRANTDYALLGITCSVPACSIGIRAPDWGNVRIAVPGGSAELLDNARFLYDLSYWLGKPCIPVFNSANRAGINIDALQDENGADPIVGIMLAELSMNP